MKPVKSIPAISSYQVQQIFSPRSSKCASLGEKSTCCSVLNITLQYIQFIYWYIANVIFHSYNTKNHAQTQPGNRGYLDHSDLISLPPIFPSSLPHTPVAYVSALLLLPLPSARLSSPPHSSWKLSYYLGVNIRHGTMDFLPTKARKSESCVFPVDTSCFSCNVLRASKHMVDDSN